MNVEYAEVARDDLRDIHAYILQRSSMARTARKYIERVMHYCERIGDFPEVGRLREDIGPAIRTLPFERLIIVYEVSSTTVLIARVFHAAQDYETLLRAP